MVDPAMITATIAFAALTVYALLGGADFGGGVLELVAGGPTKQAQRALIQRAIGPIWEANHVWMILVIVLLFTCFPRAFAAIGIALHIPILLMLVGVVFRGCAFVFRSYGDPNSRSEHLWSRVFSIASLVTPVLLGVIVGTVASGQVHFNEQGVYLSGYLRPWLRPFPWAVGAFALALFTFLAAVYLCVEASEPETRDAIRRRALLSALGVGVTAGLAWLLAVHGAPTLYQKISGSWWTWPVQIATGGVALGAIVALWRRRFLLARTLAVVQVVLILTGYAMGQLPYLVVPDITVASSAAPRITHVLVLAALAGGVVVLFPSLALLYHVFKGESAFAVFDRNGTKPAAPR